MNVLAIDQGTSSTKALVVDDANRVLGEGACPVAPRALGGGGVEQDPRQVLDSIVAAGRAALDASDVAVQAVGLANQGETVLHWDPGTGEPLGPAISWQDSRAQELTDQRRDVAGRLEQITGLPLDPYFAGPKMAWLRRRVGEGGLITTLDAWLNHRLTGRGVTDAATASRTALLDLDAVAWSTEAMALLGLSESPPEIVSCAEPIGETSAFGGSLPVTGLIVDQQAALIAESCFTAGTAKCTYGTGAFLLAHAGDRALRSRGRLACSVGWRTGDETAYCLDAQVYTAGAAVGWLTRVGLLADAGEIDPLLAGWRPTPGSPVFVPALAGLGAPDWEPRAEGRWTGLSLATSRADLVGAVIWGIAAQVARVAGTIAADLGRPLAALRVDGGLARSDALLQAQADLLQLEVERYPHAEATAFGVAALARLGADAAATLPDAVGPWQPSAVFAPRIDPTAAADHLARFEQATTEVVAAARADHTDGARV